MKKEVSLWNKFLIRFFPKSFFQKVSKKQGIGSNLTNCAEELFRSANRIDFQPLTGDHRGLIIIVDQKLSLWFFQDGDSFKYDGFEIGSYDKGKVTVFDSIQVD